MLKKCSPDQHENWKQKRDQAEQIQFFIGRFIHFESFIEHEDEQEAEKQRQIPHTAGDKSLAEEIQEILPSIHFLTSILLTAL